MKQKPVQCMVLSLALTLPCAAFSFQGQQLKVGVKLNGGCGYDVLEPTHAHFGEHTSGMDHPQKKETGKANFWCSQDIPFTVVVDDGQNSSGSTRRMKHQGTNDYIDYTLDHTPKSGTGTGNTLIHVDVDFTVAANAMKNAPPGEYEDVVTVTADL
ncbi:spore coat protein U domain-containing protein [Dyella sp. 2HG41-7]|uniref:spore coat protein U domain-containing protein n=1 Tax=Dyella sp. 2HG41-7 TaxID=2883239 RepID=UPI001F441834|nr:spore coat protein U domain-containing protein [Dyella sp. 2HG41-7]